MDVLTKLSTQLEIDCKELEPKLRNKKERLTFLTSRLHKLVAEEINFIPEREILENGERELKNYKEKLQALENEFKNIQNEKNEIYKEKQNYNEPLLKRQNRELKCKNGEIKDLLQEINNLDNLIVKSANRNKSSKKKYEENLMEMHSNYKPDSNFKLNTLRLLAEAAKTAMKTAKKSYLETQELVKELEKKAKSYQKECEKVEAALYREQENQCKILENWFQKEKRRKELLESRLREEKLKLYSAKLSLKKLTISLKTHENYNSNAETTKINQCLQKLREIKNKDNELNNKLTLLCENSRRYFQKFQEKFEKSYAVKSKQMSEIKEQIAWQNAKINNHKNKILNMQKNHSLEIEELQNFTPKRINGRYRMKLEDMKQLYARLNEKFLKEEKKLNFSREAFFENQESCQFLEKQVNELENAINEFKQTK